MSAEQPLSSRARRWLALTATLSLLAAAPAQTLVSYGGYRTGSINVAGQADRYFLQGAQAGDTLRISFCGQYTGYPCYCYHHYAELVDAAGTRVTAVDGNGASAFTFPTSGIYTLLIGARDHATTGWYATSVDCQSWPGVPCDTVPYTGNYCKGLAGTNGVPALTASPAPALGSTIAVTIGNSAGVPTASVLLIGIDALNLPFLGGTLCIADPTIVTIPNLPMAGTSFCIAIPNDSLLRGFGFALQSLVLDAGAPQSVAFSRGLMLIPG